MLRPIPLGASPSGQKTAEYVARLVCMPHCLAPEAVQTIIVDWAGPSVLPQKRQQQLPKDSANVLSYAPWGAHPGSRASAAETRAETDEGARADELSKDYSARMTPSAKITQRRPVPSAEMMRSARLTASASSRRILYRSAYMKQRALLGISMSTSTCCIAGARPRASAGTIAAGLGPWHSNPKSLHQFYSALVVAKFVYGD